MGEDPGEEDAFTEAKVAVKEIQGFRGMNSGTGL